jgi:diguanylate cyclase
MRYGENRERSTEILRLALALMGRQAAAFNPYSYALWYEHCAGLNPSLSHALEARLAAHTKLTDEDVGQLYTEHIIARDFERYAQWRDELHRILTGTAADAQVAGEKTSEFDRALVAHAGQLAAAPEPETVRNTVDALLDDTGKMRAMTAELSARLKASTAEVDALTENLRRVQSEVLLDPLTGLKNRRGFEQAAHDLQSQPGGLAGTALMMIDIDHFKTVNDSYGHLLGDKVLQAVAHVLKSNIKGRDVAARFGGEEFAVLLPDTSITGATVLARKICSLVSHGRIKRSDAQGMIGQVTLSMGLAVAESDSLDKLLERADSALYVAKRNGRNRVEIAADPQDTPS